MKWHIGRIPNLSGWSKVEIAFQKVDVFVTLCYESCDYTSVCHLHPLHQPISTYFYSRIIVSLTPVVSSDLLVTTGECKTWICTPSIDSDLLVTTPCTGYVKEDFLGDMLYPAYFGELHIQSHWHYSLQAFPLSGWTLQSWGRVYQQNLGLTVVQMVVGTAWWEIDTEAGQHP
jgi:hypothetical protein